MTLAAGTRLGPYEILAPLGAGGMGEVYRARHSTLDREVAVKVLPAHLTSNPDALARFDREAKAVAALSHPNILSIFDFGTHNGVSYSVTELLQGETLRGRLDGSTVTQKQAVEWSLQIARGLSAAHGKGVVHRDLKPDNVFVTNDGHVKILDFGLAKRVDAAPNEQTNAPTDTGHTEPGTVMGTMGYMSPEQLRGLPVDHRTDLFSFGAILYELLSGRKAFKRDSASDTIAAILKEEPPELTESGRNVSPALDHIVRHCLEKDRENRFQTAKDVAFALTEASSPTTAVTSGSYVVPPEARRGKSLAIVAAVAVLAAVVAALLWNRSKLGGASSANAGPKRIAVLPFENLGAPEDDYFADGMSDEIRGKLTSLQGVQVIARGSSTPYKKTNKTPKQIAQELNASYLLTATVRWEKSGGASRVHVSPELVDVTRPDAPTSKWQQPFDAAMTDVFQVQSDIATKVAQALGGALGAGDEKRLSEGPTQNLAAYDAFLKGEETSKAMAASDPPTIRKSLSYYEQAVALDPGFAQGWARLSVACALLYANALPEPRLAERSRQAADKAIALQPGRSEGYHALGNYERLVRGDLPRAREQYAKGLRLAPNSVDLLGSSSATEQAMGLADTALEHAKQAERLDPRSASAARRLGATFLLLRRYPEAIAALDRAVALAPSNINAIEYRVMASLAQGDLPGGRAVIRAVPKDVEPTALVAYFAQYNDLGWVLDDEQRDLLLRLTPDAFDGDRAALAICLAQAYALKGDAANARLQAEEARKGFEDQLRESPNDDQRHVLLALALAYLGKKEEAVREGLRGVELRPLAKDAFGGAYDQQVLARIYILVGDHEKALDRLEPLLKMPAIISPGWLKIDPNYAPLRGNPRFEKLVAGAK